VAQKRKKQNNLLGVKGKIYKNNDFYKIDERQCFALCVGAIGVKSG